MNKENRKFTIPELAEMLDQAKAEKAKEAVPKYQIGQRVEWSGYGSEYSGIILDFEIDVNDDGEIWITYVVDGVGRYWECELELSK